MTDLSALVEALTNVVSRSEFDDLSERVDKLGDTLEDIRKNAKGGNNWGKIASGVAAAVPILMAISKGLGWT